MRRGWAGAARRRAVVLAWAALFAAVSAGCGGGDDELVEPTTTTTESRVPPSPTVKIEYRDYGYTVGGPLVAGGTLQLRNSGKELHMMGVGRLKPRRTLEDYKRLFEPGLPAPQYDPTPAIVDMVGLPGNVISPGQAVDLTVPDLRPGRYVLVCLLPTEGQSVSHATKGMIGELRVVEGHVPEPSADATYRLEAGKAVAGPVALKAGRRTLHFEAEPGSEGLAPTLARLAPGRTFADLEKALDVFERNDPPPVGAAGRLPGQIPFAGFDLGPLRKFYLAVDLTPGTWFISAADTDRPDGATAKETLSIKVS
ncbi:MAG TPA: hypothetical protein VHE80_09610 [Acidimicrobiales bacterium]|nr:hypothetical protein [Acidimicrobiales bacterium]